MPSYANNAAFKLALNNRLKADGVWSPYLKLREFLKKQGISPATAARIAAFPFPPKDGTEPEILHDPLYSEIQAKWMNKSYPLPPDFETFKNGATNFREQKEPTPEAKAEVEKVKKAPQDWSQRWKKLASAVEVANADLVEEVQWVGAHRWTDPEDIDPATVPSKAAVCKLSAIQESSANYIEFLRTFESKLLPDRKQIEHQSKWKDDGRSLELINDLLENEESSAA
jgi:hypothetical protein